MGNQKNYQLLDRLSNMRCEVCIHSRQGNVIIATYLHNLFYYETDEDYIYLKDSMCCQNNTYTELNGILEIKNLSDDLYEDVVDLITDDFIISVATLEERPKNVVCHKCGKEIQEIDHPWIINQLAEYGSQFDGDFISLVFCDDCLVDFVGMVDNEVSEYTFN